MNEENWKHYSKKTKEYYQKIGAIPCPAFSGELIYFNRFELKHLIRKGRSLRDIGEQRKRIHLLPYAPQIIAVVRKLADYSESMKDNSCVRFWAAHYTIDNIEVRVIIRQQNNGKKHFFSIMEE